MQNESNIADTIYAPASATAKSGVIVIRISGPRAKYALEQLGGKVGSPKFTKFTQIYHPKNRSLIDECIAVYYPGPGSFTGEDTVELNIHGGKAVLNLTMEALGGIDGLRIAEPGEFSRRRFLNGKMDLTQAEGLMDLIDADTSAQHQQALRQLSGALGRLCENWRLQLLQVLSLVEAYIDFPDEDLPQDIIDGVTAKVAELNQQIVAHLDDNHRGEKLRDGFYIAIIGPTNAGKSSLMNVIAKRDVAIVSNIAGTTRDVIEIHLDLAGYPVTIADTAGIRESADFLENEGISRSLNRAENADLKILVLDVNDKSISAQIEDLIDEKTIIVVNKVDGASSRVSEEMTSHHISTTKNIGINELLQTISNYVADFFVASDAPLITRQRHRENLQRCSLCLSEFSLSKDIELAAEDLRLAARYLSSITGKIDVEMILGEIFSSFCIGK